MFMIRSDICVSSSTIPETVPSKTLWLAFGAATIGRLAARRGQATARTALHLLRCGMLDLLLVRTAPGRVPPRSRAESAFAAVCLSAPASARLLQTCTCAPAQSRDRLLFLAASVSRRVARVLLPRRRASRMGAKAPVNHHGTGSEIRCTEPAEMAQRAPRPTLPPPLRLFKFTLFSYGLLSVLTV